MERDVCLLSACRWSGCVATIAGESRSTGEGSTKRRGCSLWGHTAASFFEGRWLFCGTRSRTPSCSLERVSGEGGVRFGRNQTRRSPTRPSYRGLSIRANSPTPPSESCGAHFAAGLLKSMARWEPSDQHACCVSLAWCTGSCQTCGVSIRRPSVISTSHNPSAAHPLIGIADRSKTAAAPSNHPKITTRPSADHPPVRLAPILDREKDASLSASPMARLPTRRPLALWSFKRKIAQSCRQLLVTSLEPFNGSTIDFF